MSLDYLAEAGSVQPGGRDQRVNVILDGVILARVDRRTLLFVRKTGRRLVLNETARDLWKLLSVGESVAVLDTYLMNNYALDLATAMKEADTFVEVLAAHNLLVRGD